MAISFLCVAPPLLPSIANTPMAAQPRRSLRFRCFASPPTSSFDLRRYWSDIIPEIEAELDSALTVRPPESIHNAMRHAVFAGSHKRAPPVMCVATCDLVGAPRAAVLPFAAAIEMLHAASLIHDDLPCFDAAPLRRGRPTVQALFGAATAILAGDALFPLAFAHVIARTPAHIVPHQTLLLALTEMARAVGSDGMAAGQVLDLESHSSESAALASLEKKFGELAECSAACGAILGGASEEDIAALRKYGRSLGLLYSLVDDVLMESANGTPEGKMRSNASLVKLVGMDRALELVEETRAKAKAVLDSFAGKDYGERVLPLYAFVDYAVERGFVVEGGDVARAPTYS